MQDMATTRDLLLQRAVAYTVTQAYDAAIADLKDAEDFLKLGATRLGTSRLVKIAKEQGL